RAAPTTSGPRRPPPRQRSPARAAPRSEEHTSELQSQSKLVCRLLLEKTKKHDNSHTVLDGIINTLTATIQRIQIIGSLAGSRNRPRLKANKTGKTFRVGIKSIIRTNR